jgi:protease-4
MLMQVRDLMRNGLVACRNWVRGMRREGLEWIVLSMSGSYPELAPPPPSLPFPLKRLVPYHPEASLSEMRRAAEILGGDRRVRGVVLRMDGLRAGMSALHALRGMVQRLRADGKRVVAWLPNADMASYYLAAACDQVVMPVSGRLYLVGLRSEVMFLKDSLARIGVAADLESIAEYKTAPDMFRRAGMTAPHRQMLEAILDSYLDEFAIAIGEPRGLDRERVLALIDQMPMAAASAVETRLVDALLYEDELPDYLGVPLPGKPRRARDRRWNQLRTWEAARPWLRRPLERRARRAIGVVSIEGLIVLGESRRIPFPVPIPMLQSQVGAATVAQALRRAEMDDGIAAVILFVDSSGGSALASDLIAREVRRLRERKPTIALMGDRATSGGYYIAAGTNYIVARPTTLTGSIGIWGGKFVTSGLYNRLGINREPVQRGRIAGLYSEMALFSEEERAWVRRDMGEQYARFKAIVAAGRGMSEEQVEEVARGRVWTGAQGYEIGLVDGLGDFEEALNRAMELAEIDPQLTPSIVRVEAPKQALTALAFPSTDQAWNLVADSLRVLATERLWALPPWVVYVNT